MSKGIKRKGRTNEARSGYDIGGGRGENTVKLSDTGYAFNMSHAPKIDEPSGLLQMLPVLFFTAFIIMITRMAVYTRPMKQFFWSTGENSLNDFFSYYKMSAILFCAVVALIFMLYRFFIQSFYIKKSYTYIPIAIYALFVLMSYTFSDYKKFALWGWNDRFEGTVTLVSYMIMLFYVINTVNNEKNVKWLINSLAISSSLLGLLGLSQALNHDFFRTMIGKKMITPSWYWPNVDTLNFTFQNSEIYQTVYNINYVSFYLTLLIPLFGLLFIRSMLQGKEELIYKKVLWGGLFALLLYNLIGSASSSGLMGMAVVVILAIIVLNKRILEWYKPVVIILIITLAVGGLSYQRWMPELSGAIKGVTTSDLSEVEGSVVRHKLDFIETNDNDIVVGYKGDSIIITTYPDEPEAVSISDSKGDAIPITQSEKDAHLFQLSDQNYSWIAIQPAKDSEGNRYIVLITDEHEWPFVVTNDGAKYRTGTGNLIDLKKVESVGFNDNGSWGNGRGFIWSRSLPMIKETLLLGHGADTYCIYFPHNDYVGKYNADSYTDKMDIVVDKPHNMYIGIAIGTGVISLLALLSLWAIYIVQSFKLFSRRRYNNFISFAGVGIFLGICGFFVAGLVNDTSVSVMPMFYGLLGTGIAINSMLRRNEA